MATNTTNYNLIKPGVNDPTDQDLWGGYLNSDLDDIDTLLKTGIDNITRNVTSTDTVLISDRNKMLLCDATGGAFTETLLSAATAGNGFTVIIKKVDATANVVTVGGTLDGSATYSLSGQNEAITVVSNGTTWFISSFKTTPTSVQSASETVQGIVELATNAEVNTGTDNARSVVPSALKQAVSSCKAWVKFNGATITISGTAYNVSSVARNGGGVGDYVVNFTTPFTSSDYAVSIVTNKFAAGQGVYVGITGQTASSITFNVQRGTTSYVDYDATNIQVICFGFT